MNIAIKKQSARFLTILISIISLTLAMLTCPIFAAKKLPKPNSSIQTLDQIAALVNDEVITQSEINKIYKNVIKQIQASGQVVPDESTLKTEILNQLIYQKLQLQLAKRNHITVTNEQVNTAIKNIAKQHRMTVAALKRKIQEQGATYASYRQSIKQQITISMIQHKALASQLKVSDREVNQFLDKFKSQRKYAKQYHLIDILVTVPSAPSSTQEKQAQTEALQIMKKLRKGTNPNAIKGAEVHDLGWRTKMDLPDIFLSQLSTLKPGDIAGPLRAANGYHVIKLIKVKKSSAALPSRDQAKRILMEQKFQKLLHDWVIKLRKQSYVKIVHPQ